MYYNNTGKCACQPRILYSFLKNFLLYYAVFSIRIQTMSRAFVSDKEDWNYCAKAGERCVHADIGRDCRQRDCEHFQKTVPDHAGNSANQTSLRVVCRKPRKESSADHSADKRNQHRSQGSNSSSTKRANIKPPKRWGGRSG